MSQRHLATLEAAFTAVGAAFTALSANEAAAQCRKTALQTAVTAAVLGRGLLLILHLTLGRIIALGWRLLAIGLL